MPYLNLSRADLTLLRELLEQELKSLPVMIHHATIRKTREILELRLRHVETLIERLIAASARKAYGRGA